MVGWRESTLLPVYFYYDYDYDYCCCYLLLAVSSFCFFLPFFSAPFPPL